MKEKKNWMDLVINLDRRIIFILVALAVAIPVYFGWAVPVKISPSVQSVYDFIDNLEEGDAVFISCDFDPASEAELYPMTKALMRHCFNKKLRVLSMTMWPNGAALVERAFDEMRLEYDIEAGVDYVNFGYQVGYTMVVVAAGQDFASAFTTDYRGNTTANMPVMEGLDGLGDVAYMIDIAAGATIEMWIAYGSQRYHFPMGAGCTAVSATQYYPYLSTGQINGLLGGLKGAAEYEQLAVPDHVDNRALAGMTAQSSVHAVIVLLVILANIFYFITRKKGVR
jgi:hypothetical protein